MSLLHVGDSAILIVPPALGYGAEGGRGGLVPRNAVLTYFVDILDVKSDDLASMLLNTIETSGIDDALKQYDDLKGRGFPDIHVSEVNMNGLGYRLLKTDRKAAAIKIFQLNVEAYPHSANAYDSLGEAYASSGTSNAPLPITRRHCLSIRKRRVRPRPEAVEEQLRSKAAFALHR